MSNNRSYEFGGGAAAQHQDTSELLEQDEKITGLPEGMSVRELIGS